MNRRVKTPSLTYNAWSVSVFLMLFWGFHYSVFDILHITPIMILSVELFGVFSVLVLTARQALQNVTAMFGWVIFYLLILRNNYYIEHFYLTQPVATFLVIMLAYCLQFSDRWYKSFRQCITIFSLEHLFFSWLFMIFSGFYTSVVLPLFPDGRIHVLFEQHKQGVLMGFTHHYSVSGIYFALGCVAAFVYWLEKKTNLRRIAFAVTMLISLAMTQKRGPLLFAVCALLVIYFASEKISWRSVGIFAGSLSVAAILYFIVVAFYPPAGAVVQRFIEGGDSGRELLQSIAWELFEKAPIFGVGFGQYREYSLNYYSVEYSAHNVFLQLLAEIGIVGLTVFVVLLLVTLGLTIWSVRKIEGDRDREKRFALLFSLGCQVYFITYCFTGNPLYDPYCYIPYFISIAVPYSIFISKRKKENQSQSSNERSAV